MRKALLLIPFLTLAHGCEDDTGPDITVPTLLVPEEGAIVDNGCTGHLDLMERFFDWSDVPKAHVYHLYVRHPRGTSPVISVAVEESEYERIDDSYVIDVNRFGWEWKVRAKLGPHWMDWTPTQTFNFEPLNTDCRASG